MAKDNNRNFDDELWDKNDKSSGEDKFQDGLDEILNDSSDSLGNVSKESQFDSNEEIDGLKDENLSDSGQLSDNNLDTSKESLFDDEDTDNLEDSNLLDDVEPDDEQVDSVLDDLKDNDNLESEFGDKDKPSEDPLSDMGGGLDKNKNNKDNKDDEDDKGKDKKKGDDKDKSPKDKKKNPKNGLGKKLGGAALGAGAAKAGGKNPLSGLGNGLPSDKKGSSKDAKPASKGESEPQGNSGKVDKNSKPDKSNPLSNMGGGPGGDNGQPQSASQSKGSDEDSGKKKEPPMSPNKMSGKGTGKKAGLTIAGVAISAPVAIISTIVMVVAGINVVNNASETQRAGVISQDACAGIEGATNASSGKGSSGKAGVPDGEKSNPEIMPPGQLTSPYGNRGGEQHLGQDISTGAPDTPIFAWYGGTVTQAGPANGFGNWIVIEHDVDGEALTTVYGHMYDDGVLVNEGDEVKAGEKIGIEGSMGQSSGPHVHFEVHEGEWTQGGGIDPKPYLEDAVNPDDMDGDSDSGSKDDEDSDSDNSDSSESTSTANESSDEITVKPAAEDSDSEDSEDSSSNDDEDSDSKGNQESSGIDDDGNEKIGGTTIMNADKLKKDAYYLARSVADEFPEVNTIGGWRPSDPYPDHPSGKAVDIMIPNYETEKGKSLGKEINKFVWDNKEDFGVVYTIWRQDYYDSDAENGSQMDDRGDPTQNHMDHVHVTTESDEESENYNGGPGGSRSANSVGSATSGCCVASDGSGENSKGGQFKDEGNEVDQNGIIEENAKIIIGVGEHLDKSKDEIILALMTAKHESGGFKNYANDGSGAMDGVVTSEEVAKSLDYPHDAVGHDHDSVGPFQQRVGMWGDVEDLMKVAFQAGQFYAEMENKGGYDGGDKGAFISSVQGNATGTEVYSVEEEPATEIYEKYKGANISDQEEKDGKRGYENRLTGSDGMNSSSGSGDSGKGDSSGSSSSAKNDGCAVSSNSTSSDDESSSEDFKNVGWIGDSTAVSMHTDGDGELKLNDDTGSDGPAPEMFKDNGIEELYYDISVGKSFSNGGLKAMDGVGKGNSIDAYLITMGTNDSVGLSSKDDAVEIIEKVMDKADGAKVIWMAPVVASNTDNDSLDQEKTDMFKEGLDEVAGDNDNLKVIDMKSKMEKAGGTDGLSTNLDDWFGGDGTHYNGEKVNEWRSQQAADSLK